MLPLKTVEKLNMKKEKNRESARKARTRKNLYIKLLETHVRKLEAENKEGIKVEAESVDFYAELRNLNN